MGQDSLLKVDDKIVTLKEVVVLSNLDVPGFVRRIQLDTSFYRAFKNLRELNYTALNDVRMLNKKGANMIRKILITVFRSLKSI